MRILQVGPIPPEIGGKTVGGVATHVWDLSRHLAKRGHEVAILADNFPDPPEIPVIKEGVKIYGFSKTIVLKHLPSVLLNPITIYKLKKHLKDLMGITGVIANFCYYKYVLHHFSPDVIHVHHLESRFPFAYHVTNGCVPIVVTVHSFSSIKVSTSEQNQRYYKLIAKNLKLSQNLIFVSNSLKAECKQLFGGLKARAWIVNNPIDTAKYCLIDKNKARRRIGLSDETPILLFVGKLNKAKGIYTLLEAVKLLKEKEKKSKLIIIGDGPERKGVQDFVLKNTLQNMIRLEGRKEPFELLYYYNAADLFVMPSLSESFGIVFIEAMACGVPAIGTDIISEEVIPSENFGFRVPLNDSKALADTIERALNKKWDNSVIIQYARSFSWEKKITEYEEIYKNVLKKFKSVKND